MAERLVLVDGSGLIFRAYFALPSNLTTKSGLHTNAIYGFSVMFSKLLSRRVPDYGAVIFDPPGGSFRNEKFSDYKAQRPKADDDLLEQLPWIDKVVEAHNFRILRVPGYEADDVIGTLTRQAREARIEVHIISSDKDFAQLIGDDVRMHDTLKDVTYDSELVRKKWGVLPHNFIDYLALIGDKVDNIPGVPGIGPKGAIALLEEFGSLEGIFTHLESVQGKNRKLLEEHRDKALLSQELARIDQHVELPLTLEELRYTSPKVQELNELYRELEFYSLLNDGAKAKQAQDESSASDYAAWSAGAERPRQLCGLQIVYTGAAVEQRVAGLAISQGPGQARFVPADSLEEWADWLADPSLPKVVHDLRPLMVALGDRKLAGAWDTRLASFLCEPTKLIPHELSAIVKEYLQRTLVPASKTPSPETLLLEACHQADLILQVWPHLQERLQQLQLWNQFVEFEQPLTEVLAEMQRVGVRVDRDDLDRLGREFRERLAHIEQEVYLLAGRELNLGSTKQLGALLFDELKLPVIKRTKTGYSTDAEVLERLAPKHDIPRLLLEHRKLAKLINTYTDVLAQAIFSDGRIHASYQQTVSATGRLISTEPDLQRTPIRTPEGVRIRQAFIAAEGYRLISADWSQVELRIMAHFSDDPLLVEAFRNDLDIHRRTASQLFGVGLDEVTPAQREVAKTVNFATIYGQGATALAQILDVPRKTALEYIESYFVSYARVRQWLDATIAQAHRDGYVTTLLGRRRFIPELSSRNPIERQAGERIAANTPIQGTAADLCKLAMLNIHRKLSGSGVRMVLQIHDELVMEAPHSEVEEAARIVRQEMEHVYQLKVPLKVNLGVGASWAEAH